MSDNYSPCFNRIDFVAILYCTKLPCGDIKLATSVSNFLFEKTGKIDITRKIHLASMINCLKGYWEKVIREIKPLITKLFFLNKKYSTK